MMMTTLYFVDNYNKALLAVAVAVANEFCSQNYVLQREFETLVEFTLQKVGEFSSMSTVAR